jgi:AcrR family transcriptional regulator
MAHQSTLRHTNSARRRKAARSYESPLRAEQAEQTRMRIVQAYGDEIIALEEGGELTVRQIAARAGVSIPTLYRNFASLEELADAFWTWFEPQISSYASVEGPDDLPALAARMFERFAALGPVIRAMGLTVSGRQLRDRTVVKRNQLFQRTLAPLTKRLPERDAHAVIGVCKVLTSAHVWSLLQKDWGLDGAEAGRAVAWALRVLIQTLRKDPKTLQKDE